MIKYCLAGIGGAVLVGLIVWFGGRSIGADVLMAGWAIPANIVIHLLQLTCAAGAWRLLVGDGALSLPAFLRLRVIRESINSLLPVAQVGGPVISVRLMIAAGVNGAIAAAATTLDITVELAMQLLFTLSGLAVLHAEGIDPDWARWLELGLAICALGLVIFVLAQRAGLMHVIERLLAKLQRIFPRLKLGSMQGLHLELMRLQRDRWILVKAALLQLLSWVGGSFEIYLGLRAMGQGVSLQQGFIIESLGMAARSAGFAIPGALGIQEGGFILACSLFGIAPEVGLALSMLKRLREIIIGGVGLAMWQGTEMLRHFRARRQP